VRITDPPEAGPYTTLTVREYSRLVRVMTKLRAQVQKSRELLEKGRGGEALALLAADVDESEA
jgi:hypothetical protein